MGGRMSDPLNTRRLERSNTSSWKWGKYCMDKASWILFFSNFTILRYRILNFQMTAKDSVENPAITAFKGQFPYSSRRHDHSWSSWSRWLLVSFPTLPSPIRPSSPLLVEVEDQQKGLLGQHVFCSRSKSLSKITQGRIGNGLNEEGAGSTDSLDNPCSPTSHNFNLYSSSLSR